MEMREGLQLCLAAFGSLDSIQLMTLGFATLFIRWLVTWVRLGRLSESNHSSFDLR